MVNLESQGRQGSVVQLAPLVLMAPMVQPALLVLTEQMV
jgi:hypothetical protein